MGEMGNAALAGEYRGVERDAADDPNEVLHLDGKEKIKINDLIRVNETIGKEDAVNAGRSADAGRDLARQKKSVENAAAEHRHKIIFKKEKGAPAAFQIAAEHP